MGRYIKNKEIKSGSYSVRMPMGSSVLGPNAPVPGLTRFNSNKNRLEVYRAVIRNGLPEMRWVGLAFASDIDYPNKETFYGTGTQVVFGPMKYKYPKNNEVYLRVYVHNIHQNPGVAYLIDDYSIVFSSPPPDGHPIIIIHGALPGDPFEQIPSTWQAPARIFTETSYRVTSNLKRLIEVDSNVAMFTVTTTNVEDGTELYWKIRPGNIPVTDQDFVLGLPPDILAGNLRIQSNQATFNVEIKTDYITEHDESFYVDIMTGNIYGTVVTTSVEYEIELFDERPKTYEISQDLYLINKGSTVTFTVNTTKVSDGTNLHWQVMPGPYNPITYIDIDGSNATTIKTGTVTITGNTGSFGVTAAYSATDLGKRFYVQLRDTSLITGNIVANSAMTSIGLKLFLGPF